MFITSVIEDVIVLCVLGEVGTVWKELEKSSWNSSDMFYHVFFFFFVSMKRAASPYLVEVVTEAVSISDTGEIVTEIPLQNFKRPKIEEEVCLDDGYVVRLCIG